MDQNSDRAPPPVRANTSARAFLKSKTSEPNDIVLQVTNPLAAIDATKRPPPVARAISTAAPAIPISAGAVPQQLSSHAPTQPDANASKNAHVELTHSAPTVIATSTPAPAPTTSGATSGATSATPATASTAAPAATTAATPAPAAPEEDTSKQCGPVCVCNPCRDKPLSIGFIWLFSLLCVLIALLTASGVVAKQRADSAATAAISYSVTGSDDAPYLTAPILMSLPFDLKSNLTQLTSIFGTTTPNTYLPLFCSESTNICDYTTWTGSTNDFDILGANRDNKVNLIGSGSDNANYVRLEISWGNFVPMATGGTVQMSYRVVLPRILVDDNLSPPTSLFQLQFNLGATFIRIAQGSTSFTGSVTLNLDTGSISLFPFDKYTMTLSISLSISDPKPNFGAYTVNTPTPKSILSVYPLPLSFILKVDGSDVGLFSHTEQIVPAPAASANNNAPSAIITATFARPSISVIFPMFIMIAFWIIAVFDVLNLTPYIGTGTKLPPPIVGVCASLLFALPGIRNAMPGGAPIGSVLDFVSYFWALVIAVFCFAWAVSRLVIDTHPAMPAVKKTQ
jgi:hypothetical protein